jgi:hypothetical protein
MVDGFSDVSKYCSTVINDTFGRMLAYMVVHLLVFILYSTCDPLYLEGSQGPRTCTYVLLCVCSIFGRKI